MIVKENLNELPVKTYRWLKVNELVLSQPLAIELRPYEKDYLSFSPLPGLEVRLMPQTPLDERLGTGQRVYGVSRELVELAETTPNAGIQVRAARGVQSDDPVVVRYHLDAENPVVIDHNVVYAEQGSRVTVIFDYLSDDCAALHNGTLQVYAESDAEVNIVRLQRMSVTSYHLDSVIAYAAEGAEVKFVHVDLGGALTALNYTAELKGKAEVSINGAYFGDGTRQLDLNYYADHEGVGSISSILVHGALKDQAKKVFRGTIDFKRGARQSKGSEVESVLLLNEGVRSIAVPLLLAGEDDVEGEHAASAGRVDGEKLHYLMSRGLSRDQATKLLVEAAFQPIIDELPGKEWQSLVRGELERRLI